MSKFYFQAGFYYVSREGYDNYVAKVADYAKKINESLSKKMDMEKTESGPVYSMSEAQQHRQILALMQEKLDNVIIFPDQKDILGVALGNIVTVKHYSDDEILNYKITGNMELSVGTIDQKVIEVNLNSPLVRTIYGEEEGVIMRHGEEKIEIIAIQKQKTKRK